MQFFSLVSVVILFRALSKEAVGNWAVFLAIITIIEVGRTGLLQNALVKFLSTEERSNTSNSPYSIIATASLTLNVLITVLIVGVLFLSAKSIAVYFEVPALETLLKLHCTTTIALVPFLQLMFMQYANLEFRGVFWGTFVRQGINFLYIVGCFVMHYDIELNHLVIVRTVGVLVGALVSFRFARPFLYFSRQLSWTWMMKLLHYGKYLMGTSLGAMVYKGTDRLMIGKLLGEIPVALFDPAIKITNLVEAPTFSVATILFPQSARKMKEGKATIKLLYEKAVGAILAILLPALLTVLVFAEWAVWIVAGAGYEEAVGILRVTMFYGIFIPFAVQFGTVLDATGKPKINFLVTLISALMNVGLNYVFIRYFGTIGAAYGTLVTYFLTFLFMQYYLSRTFGIRAFAAFEYMLEFYKAIPTLIKTRLGRES